MHPHKGLYENRKYFLRRPFVVSFWARAYAKMMDFAIVFLCLVLIPYPWGPSVGILYLSYADSLFAGQSLGKRWIGLSVISLEDGSVCNASQSLIRNLPFLLPLLVLLYPHGTWRYIFLGLFFPPFVLLELFILHKMGSGLRLGDLLADTTVMGTGGPQKIITPLNAKWVQDLKFACGSANRNPPESEIK